MSEMKYKSLVPADGLKGDDAEDTSLLRGMLADARQYLLDKPWCRSVAESYFGLGVGGVVGAFLFRIEPEQDADDWLWIVVGDLPSAYLVVDQIERPVDALVVYCDIMQGWVDAVINGTPLDDEYPVEAPADVEHAHMLGQRVQMIRDEVIPIFS